MNKYLTLSLALAASSAIASPEVLVGTGVGFEANTETPNKGHVGIVLNAEHHRPLSDESGYFVASNVYVAPAIMKDKAAPVSAGLVVGGAFKSAAVPATAQIGLSVDVANSVAGNYKVAPGVMVGGIYNMTDKVALKTSSTFSFPSDKLGVYKSADIKTSIGLSTSIAVAA